MSTLILVPPCFNGGYERSITTELQWREPLGTPSANTTFSNGPTCQLWFHVLEPHRDEQQLSPTSTPAFQCGNAVKGEKKYIYKKKFIRNRRQRGKYPVPKVEPNSHNNFPRHRAQGLVNRDSNPQEKSKESGIASANTSR